MNKNPCGRCYGQGRLQSVVGPRPCPACKGTGSLPTDAKQNRRAFLAGATSLAVGAALGIPGVQRPREIGPVDLWFYLFSAKPHVIPVALMSDEASDTFTIRTLEKDIHVEVSMSLSKVKDILPKHLGYAYLDGTFKSGDKPVEVYQMYASSSFGEFALNMGIGVDKCPPLWMKTKDVHKAMFS